MLDEVVLGQVSLRVLWFSSCRHSTNVPFSRV
jgi:hypothetical protein